ncbi:hypothetical protein EYF80_054764 [Liparis tanakae]|uniref:Uncharacterized protein n=1 Tax=Liparis tanakae TaxID=230148 RepID=A0A4Z2F3K4_9TELE|nr:hypothetical protein EYF80_054764 [Liparis tanakae]
MVTAGDRLLVTAQSLDGISMTKEMREDYSRRHFNASSQERVTKRKTKREVEDTPEEGSRCLIKPKKSHDRSKGRPRLPLPAPTASCMSGFLPVGVLRNTGLS